MTLSLRDLSFESLLQPILELQELISQLKALRWSASSLQAAIQRTEIIENMDSVDMHLGHVIAFYEHVFEESKADLRNAVREYVNHMWQVPPLTGPRWEE